MKKRILYLLLIFMTILFIFNTACSKKESKNFKSSYKKIRVVMDDNYPPYVFKDSHGNLQGILIDEWKLWEEKTGIKAEITAISWNDALNSMKNNQYDVIDTIFYTKERALSFDFTKPYASIQVPIFFNENISGITDIDTLKGFTVAVKKGDNSEKILKDRGVTDIIEFNNYEDIINAARERKIMVFIMDKPPALYYMSRANIIDKFKFSEPLYSGEFHRAVKKGNTELKNTVENGFSLITEGEYKNIENKWFGVNYYPNYIKYIKYAALIIAVLVLLLIIWNYVLKRKVEMRTSELTELMNRLKTSEERYRGLLAKINAGVAVFSDTGEVIISNDEFKKIFGYRDGQLLNDSGIIINDEGTVINISQLLDMVLSTKNPIKDKTLGIIIKNSKEISWVKADLTPEFDKNENIEGIIGTYADITERKIAVEALQESEHKIRTIIETIPDLVFIINRKGVFLEYLSKDINKAYYPKEYFIGKCVYDIFPEEISLEFKKCIENVILNGASDVCEYPMDFDNRNWHFEARFVSYGTNKILAMVRDITERKTSEKKMFYMSMHDSLTGLYNRNYFEMELQRFSNQDINDAALIICDIDGLKLVNDTMGHGEGDKYIRITANILKTCFGENDVIARIGGDEFAALVRHVNQDIIDRIKVKIKSMVKGYNDGYHIPVSISLGYAIMGDNKTINDIFKEADDYMYREKLYNIQSSRSRNLDILIKMLEVRDFNTEDHGERLTEAAAALCIRYGMSESEIRDMRLFAQFHDIGKIGIPDSVLFKPGKLSSEEWSIMKKHSDIGYRIAQTSPDLVHISDWILKHHEMWDGTGYPFGLKGEEIPIQCRILSIIDSYDAMTNDRPYRKAMSKEAAIEELKLNSGKQFDPLLVKMFLNIL